MKQHALKIWPAFFQSMAEGFRNAEIRINDRDFKAGETICFQEWDPGRKDYTGRSFVREITFVAAGPFYASTGFAVIPEGYAILSLAMTEVKAVDDSPRTFTARAPYDCASKLQAGEPSFLLRGQDLLAPELVRTWGDRARMNGCDDSKTREAFEIADRMEAWTPRKYPD